MSESRSKYNAEPITYDGHNFDSLAEANRYKELILMQRRGLISGLEVHIRFEILPAFKQGGRKVQAHYYEADFVYVENGKTIVEDVKGAIKTALFSLKWAMMRHLYPDYVFRIEYRGRGAKRKRVRRAQDGRK